MRNDRRTKPVSVKAQPMWRLLQQCAHALTEAGYVPFTRGDLIECVKRRAPKANPGSINPVIQGITDNLQDGSPGATGRDILHSVGRGKFVLRAEGGVPSENGRRVRKGLVVGLEGGGWRVRGVRPLEGPGPRGLAPATPARRGRDRAVADGDVGTERVREPLAVKGLGEPRLDVGGDHVVSSRAVKRMRGPGRCPAADGRGSHMGASLGGR